MSENQSVPCVGSECWVCYKGGSQHHAVITYRGNGVACYWRDSKKKEYVIGDLSVVEFIPVSDNESLAVDAIKDLEELLTYRAGRIDSYTKKKIQEVVNNLMPVRWNK